MYLCIHVTSSSDPWTLVYIYLNVSTDAAKVKSQRAPQIVHWWGGGEECFYFTPRLQRGVAVSFTTRHTWNLSAFSVAGWIIVYTDAWNVMHLFHNPSQPLCHPAVQRSEILTPKKRSIICMSSVMCGTYPRCSQLLKTKPIKTQPVLLCGFYSSIVEYMKLRD